VEVGSSSSRVPEQQLGSSRGQEQQLGSSRGPEQLLGSSREMGHQERDANTWSNSKNLRYRYMSNDKVTVTVGGMSHKILLIHSFIHFHLQPLVG
jgi:hypothetical protein